MKRTIAADDKAKAAKTPLSPAPMDARFDDAISETPRTAIASSLARKIEAATLRSWRFSNISRSQPKTRHPDGQVDEEDAAPARKGDKGAASKGPCRERNACPGRPKSDGAPSFFLISKCMVEERERVRHKNGRANPLDGPESNEARGCWSQLRKRATPA